MNSIFTKTVLKSLFSKGQQRDLLILLAISLTWRSATAILITQPGYIDAAYYFDVAKNLASGHGFTEDFIITYLTPATSVVHPSNLYWMPLTSIIIAPFLSLFGSNWRIAQIPIVLLSASLPLLIYWIIWDIFRSRRYACAIALFMLLGSSIYSSYFLATDSFALYGWVSLLALVGMYQGWRGHAWRFALAGIAIGLAHLTRSDGILLLLIGCMIWLYSQKKSTFWKASGSNELHPIPWQALLGMCSFYLLTMTPWFIRNLILIGSPLPTWGTITMWLTSYNDFFTFHKVISAHTYLNWGVHNILFSKLLGLAENYLILNEVVYIPFVFVILGMWIERKRAELLPFQLYLLLMYSVFSLIFTYPSIHGSLLHSVIGLLPYLYASGLVGVDAVIVYIVKRFGKSHATEKRTLSLVLILAIGFAAILSGKALLDMHASWNQDYLFYQKVGEVVVRDYRAESNLHRSPQLVVMAGDSADYYYATGQHAVLLPAQDLATVLAAAQRYAVSYILFVPDQGQMEARLWRKTLIDRRLKLIWTASAGKLYRFAR